MRMTRELGRVSELVRYPVKSMAGAVAASAVLGWHGLDGDRRFAFRKIGDGSGFPWLTASRVAELLLYHPDGLDGSTGEPLPTHVLTPAGPLAPVGAAGPLDITSKVRTFIHHEGDDDDGRFYQHRPVAPGTLMTAA